VLEVPLGLAMELGALVYLIPPELALNLSVVSILWLEVFADSLLHALVFYYVNVLGGLGGKNGVYVRVCMREAKI